jgi:3-hydroxyisobutyrate dehydrogenase
MTRVGWIGLGAMGSPMAGCVARAGHDVTAYDIDPGRAASLAADGVKPAASISEAAAGADVLVLMVATADQVESVLYGDDPAAPELAPGAVVVVMATVGPAAVARWADRLTEQQVELVDAPVSGGVARAAAGDLLIMVGGSEAAVRRAQPLLDAMARNAPVVGPTPGDGQKVKLVNQLLCGVHIAVAAEALALAEAMHLDPAATWEVVRAGAAASFMLDDRGERMVHGADEVKSALDIFVKDMGLVLDAARATSYPAPLASAAEQLYLAGRRAGLGRRDDSSVIEILRGGPSPAQPGG